jgi:23S rRNA pseudouridine1911/1915/1917 synthase
VPASVPPEAGSRTRRLMVEAAGRTARLDRLLADAFPDLSRSRVRALIDSGHVTVQGRPARPADRPAPGAEVELHEPPAGPAAPGPEDIPLQVVHEDADLLVIDKPAGLVVHPGAGHRAGTLVSALLHRVRDLSGVGGVLRPGIVHRLDRGTSGLMVVAKNDAAHLALARQFAARTVQKEYLALVVGAPRVRQATLAQPIGRDPRHRQRMSVRARRARPAETRYVVEEAFAGAALLRVRIRTGRTHQIRVHLAAAGHPVAGDATYGGGRAPRRAGEPLAALDRPALHAASLAFDHPRTGARLAFTSPLPEDLRRAVEALRVARASG